jgi:transposase
MHDRHDLIDEERALLEPLLPDRAPQRGGQWGDHRPMVNGVLWRVRTGAPWRDMPGAYGKWQTVYYRHRRWSADGTWERALDGLRAGCDAGQGERWTVGVDSTVVRAHADAAGARHALPVDVPAARLVGVLEDAAATPGHTGGFVELQGSRRP